MKAIHLILAITVLCCMFPQCANDSTRLQVSIIQHPQGGTNISELTCVFAGRLTEGETPITARYEWWWMHETG